jgi:hypothetical protein
MAKATRNTSKGHEKPTDMKGSKFSPMPNAGGDDWLVPFGHRETGKSARFNPKLNPTRK